MDKSCELIVSVSGIRGIVGSSLSPTDVMAFAQALGTAVAGGRVVIGRDGRPSGQFLRHAVVAGLLSTGCEVLDLGVLPTPTCGLAIRRFKAAGGIQITASHNPAEWNGLKLFDGEGRVYSPSAGQAIVDLYSSRRFRSAAWNELGHVADRAEAIGWHRDRVLELVDVPLIRSRKLRAFLDANGGAGGPLGKKLLEAFQCQPVCVACHADGHFLHEPEPTEENLRDICSRVPECAADIGFALDPDADRLALIDETGRYIGEELTLALAVMFRLRQQPGPIVINMSTSRVNDDIARSFGCECHRSAVGEANVVDRMREVNAVIGGEGNGGVIDPRVGWVRDPFIAMGLILNLMAETGRKLSELTAGLTAYKIVKSKCALPREQLPALYAALLARWPAAAASKLDGLRLDWPDHWLHIRPSNTEPIVRIIAEARTEKEAAELCHAVANLPREAILANIPRAADVSLPSSP